MLLPAPARVGRRLELADQAQLFECCLELGTEEAPLDALEREQRRFDRGPLAVAPEVGAQTGAKIAGPPDVEHLIVAVAKQVDAGPRGRSVRKRALVMDSALARRRELSQVGEAPGAHLLGQPDQVHEHLSRRLGVRKRTVTRLGRNAEEVSERSQADAAEPALEQAARERGRAERRLGKAPTVQLLLEEALIEPGVVRHEQVIAGEGEEAPDDAADGGCSTQLLLAQAGEAGYVLGEGDPRIDERLEGADRLERANADGSELADLVPGGREPGRLQVEDDELGLLEQRVRAFPRQGDGCAGADDSVVAGADLFQEGAGKPLGDRRGREEQPCGLDGRQDPLLFERVHQPVESVERKLHTQMKANIRSLGKLDASRAATASPLLQGGRGARRE